MNSRPRRAIGLDVNRVADGYVVYCLAEQRVHYLNLTGAFIFELCDGNTPIEGMPDLVREAFHMTEPPTEAVRECLAELHRALLIE